MVDIYTNATFPINSYVDSFFGGFNTAIFYDFIPVILQHMKQKETLDEINKEHENYWLYEKINSIYSNIRIG